MTELDPTLVTAGILSHGGYVLVCQRHRDDPYGLQWEFPGGKAGPMETPEQSLRRELAEELAIQAEVGHEVFRVRHHYPDRFVEVIFFAVPGYRGCIRNRVFEAVEWAAREKLHEYRFLEADLELVRRISSGAIQ